MINNLTTNVSQTQNAFDYIREINQKLRKLDVVPFVVEVLFNSFLNEIELLYESILLKIMGFRRNHLIDLDYYEKIFYTQKGCLSETYIVDSDPLYASFKLIKRLLDACNNLNKEFLETPSINVLSTVNEELILKLILNNLIIFNKDLNNSMLNRYTLKKQGSDLRIKIDVSTKYEIDNNLKKYIKDHQIQNDKPSKIEQMQTKLIFTTSKSHKNQIIRNELYPIEEVLDESETTQIEETFTHNKEEVNQYCLVNQDSLINQYSLVNSTSLVNQDSLISRDNLAIKDSLVNSKFQKKYISINNPTVSNYPKNYSRGTFLAFLFPYIFVTLVFILLIKKYLQ